MVEIQGTVASSAFRIENGHRFLSVLLMTDDGEFVVKVRQPCLCERYKFWACGASVTLTGNYSENCFEAVGVKLHRSEVQNAHPNGKFAQS